MNFSILKNQTLIKISVNKEEDEMIFETYEGKKYKLHHIADCCESVYIESIEGELNDLLFYPLLQAEEISNENIKELPDHLIPVQMSGVDTFHLKNPNREKKQLWTGYTNESYTWTFYKLATIKGYVTIRWLGESNGYYSEKVDFDEIEITKLENEDAEICL